MSRVWSNGIIGRRAECAALVSDRAAKRQSLQCPKGKRAQAEKLEHEHARGCLARRHTRAPSPARGEIPKRRSVASVRRCSTARPRLARITRKTPHMCISALLWVGRASGERPSVCASSRAFWVLVLLRVWTAHCRTGHF